MADRFQFRRDTAANWTSVNPVLAEGELGLVTDDLSYKIGDGTSTWSALSARELTGVFGGGLTLDAIANPSTPSAGTAAFWAHDVGGRILPKWMGPSGVDVILQSGLGGNYIAYAGPSTTTSFTTMGVAAPTAVGTVAQPAIVAGTDLRSSMRRFTITSAATANSASELRFAYSLCYRGEVFSAATAGGFFCQTRFGISSSTANQRCAVGLWANTAATATTQAPSALVSGVWAGWDSADTNLQIMHNDGSGTATKVNLGSSFPANNTSAMYEVTFFNKPNGDEVTYRVLRLDTGDVASGTLSTDLPTKTTLLTWHAYANNGGTAAAVVMNFSRFYLETDF